MCVCVCVRAHRRIGYECGLVFCHIEPFPVEVLLTTKVTTKVKSRKRKAKD